MVEGEAHVTISLDGIEKLITNADDPEWANEARRLLDMVIADREARRRRAEAPPGEALSIRKVLAASAKQLRAGASPRLTQKGLAKRMTDAGHVGWVRLTVTECESGRRAISIEEALSLARIFGVTLADMLGNVEPGESVVINDTSTIDRDEYLQLLGVAK